MPSKKTVNQGAELPVLSKVSPADTDPETDEILIPTPPETPKKEPKVFDEDELVVEKMKYNNEQALAKAEREPEFYIFKLIADNPNVRPKKFESLSNEMTIFHEESGTNRTIRLLKGAKSIFLDEQEGFTPQYVQRNKIEIMFNDGYLRVPRTNRLMLSFMLTSDDYSGKRNRLRTKKPKYELVNTRETENAELEKQQFRLRAINYAMNVAEADMIIHAEFLGIPSRNEYGEDYSPAAIRVRYANYAGSKPEYFTSTAGTPISKAQYYAKKGIASGVLDVTTRQGYLLWRGGNKPIIEIPFGKSAVEVIAEFALSATADASSFYTKLKELV